MACYSVTWLLESDKVQGLPVFSLERSEQRGSLFSLVNAFPDYDRNSIDNGRDSRRNGVF